MDIQERGLEVVWRRDVLEGAAITGGLTALGSDVGKVAVSATRGAIEAAHEVGADAGNVMKHAVTGAIEAADEIGEDTAKAVRNVLAESIEGAKDVIKAPFK